MPIDSHLIQETMKKIFKLFTLVIGYVIDRSIVR